MFVLTDLLTEYLYAFAFFGAIATLGGILVIGEWVWERIRP